MMRAIYFCLLFVFVLVCSGTADAKKKPSLGSFSTGEAWCEMCVIAMQQASVLIKEKEDSGQVNATLYSLCDVMKGSMKQSCYQMIPLIERQIAEGFDPERACVMLQFCGGDGNAQKLMMTIAANMQENRGQVWNDAGHIMKQVVPHLDSAFHKIRTANSSIKVTFSVSCMLCRTGVSLIDNSLERYKQPLVDYVITVCNSLPMPTSMACSESMGRYIPIWWAEFFNNIASADEVCYKLHLCEDVARK